MFIRKIVKLLRGRATPAQIIMACVLGSMLGFIPGFWQGPGLTVALLGLLVVLNANLLVAAIAGLVAKALALALLPVSYGLGRVLLDGPTRGLFEALINAPVLALFGFEYYATTGGVVLGLVIGAAMGMGLVALLQGFRRRMARLEEGSPRYAELSRKWWARALVFLLAGRGRGRRSYDDLLERRFGNPVRTVGVVLVVLVAVLLGVLYQFASGPIVTAWLQHGLERANGATVDLEAAELDPASGRLALTRLAMADPNELDRDLLRAERLEADVSATDLLRKRVALDRLVLIDAACGEPRRTPGRLVGPPPRPSQRPVAVPDGKPLEEYLRQAQQWKDRLAQIRRWLEPLTRRQRAPQGRPLSERLAAAVRAHGYARVRAAHLVAGAPTFTVYELLAEGVRSGYLEGETLTIRGRNLSTQPYLLEAPPRLEVASSGGTLRAVVDEQPAQARTALELQCRDLPGDAIGRALAVTGDPPLRGGRVDVSGDGAWEGPEGGLELPLEITLRDTALQIGGGEPRRVERLVLPLAVRGRIDDPRIVLDDQLLARALMDAGAGELAGRLRDKAGEELGGDLGKEVDAIKKGIGDLLGGSRKDDDGG